MEYTYDPDSDIKKPHLISQAELDDLVRDLSLSKEKYKTVGFQTEGVELTPERCYSFNFS